jgi:hypothetical protein
VSAVPTRTEKVVPLFPCGDHDVAVFQAFKKIEVAVRNAADVEGAGYADSGTTLMRKGLHPETGPLADRTLVRAERGRDAPVRSGHRPCQEPDELPRPRDDGCPCSKTFLREAYDEARMTEVAVASASRTLGMMCLLQGNFLEAQAHLERSLEICDPERDREVKFQFG